MAISNTLDLTLRARLVLPDGATPLVLPFKAYAGPDMVSIVSSRLLSAGSGEGGEGVKVDAKAIELLSKKVEAQNGDLRMCLGVLSSAVSLAESEWTKKKDAATTTSTGSDEAVLVPLIKVSLSHVLKALNTHTQQLRAAAGSGAATAKSVTGKKIRSVPLQGRMVLVAMLVFITRARAGLAGCPTVVGSGSGNSTPTSTPTKNRSVEIMTTSNLYATYVHLLSHHTSPFPPSSESDYRDLLSNLEVLGLISLGGGASLTSRTSSMAGGRTKSGQRVEWCVRYNEVKEGLGLNDGGAETNGKGLADEEVGKVWEREESRVRRAKEKATRVEARGEIDEL